MSKDTIKGLTAKIGADTSDFIKGLKNIDKQINSTQRLANELQKGLKLEFNNLRFIEAQKQVQSVLKQTEEKASAIRKELKRLEELGAIDTEGYRKLQTELAKVETRALGAKKQLKELDEIKLNEATKEVKKYGEKLNEASKKSALLSVSAAGLLLGINKLTKSTVETGDEIATLANKYDMSAESIQKWNYIALQSDVSSDSLYKGLSKVREVIGKGLVGETNSSTQAIQALGLNISSFGNSEEAFKAIVEQMSNIKDSTLQAYYANQIFGTELATQLLPIIKTGEGNINKFASEFEQIGYLSNEQVQSLSEFDNEMNKVNAQFENAKLQLGLALMPILENLNAFLTDFIVPIVKSLAEWFGNLSTPLQRIVTGGIMLVASLSPVFMIMSKISGILPTLKDKMKALNNATTQVKFGFAALTGALSLTFDLIGHWGEMSALEKVLATLALAALTAAAAMTIFHASWSLGIAVGVIAAAVVAGIAMINSAAKNIGVETDFDDETSVKNSVMNYETPSSSNYGNGNNTYNEDNSQYNIEVNLNASGNLDYDANTLADEIIKQIAIKKQAGGR